MCGICGVVDTAAPVDRGLLERMTQTLRHRGPDDDGFYLAEPNRSRPGVGLGFRRLSIIDVAGGAQPIPNEDRSIWVVLNGEIYNFVELRDELRAKGHRFRTLSDTEAIVHLYEELGPRCVERLRGMFALAIWDANVGRLLLARDRFGKKPLYYAELGGRFVFASEVKALLE